MFFWKLTRLPDDCFGFRLAKHHPGIQLCVEAMLESGLPLAILMHLGQVIWIKASGVWTSGHLEQTFSIPSLRTLMFWTHLFITETIFCHPDLSTFGCKAISRLLGSSTSFLVSSLPLQCSTSKAFRPAETILCLRFFGKRAPSRKGEVPVTKPSNNLYQPCHEISASWTRHLQCNQKSQREKSPSCRFWLFGGCTVHQWILSHGSFCEKGRRWFLGSNVYASSNGSVGYRYLFKEDGPQPSTAFLSSCFANMKMVTGYFEYCPSWYLKAKTFWRPFGRFPWLCGGSSRPQPRCGIGWLMFGIF